MTPKERAAMQQALEALEAGIRPSYQRQFISRIEAITALREALAEQAEQEPVACDEHCKYDDGICMKHHYATPVRTKDLTDDEIYPLYPEGPMCDKDMIDFARAVISKFKEKNK